MNVFCNIDKRSPIKVSPELREVLLEFTMTCLLEQPKELLHYAQDYFDDLVDKKTALENEVSVNSDDEDEEAHEFPSDFDMEARGRGRVVYSEGYNPEKDDDDDEDLPEYKKTDEQKDMLANVTKQCLLFRAVDEHHLEKVIDVMFPVEVVPGDYVIKQYDDGDNFYIIEFGIYDVFIADDPDSEPKHIFSYMNSGSFGELALMYNMPRAATVKAVTVGRLWAMDRQTFRKIVLKAAFKKRKMYEALLSHVPMLEELTTYERMSLADALLPKLFQPGDIIMQEGDVADGMYFIESGTVSVYITAHDGTQKEISVLTDNDYFGELALVKDQPRAATVIADVESKLAFLDRAAFERILGPCMDIMKRNIDNYTAQVNKILHEGI